jgi:NAD(P)-dependent dehydrogenase (short-subunit alcohol dehydrogenase family)
MQMNEQTILITGANSGVGFAAASELAVAGAEIVMVCRNADRAADAQRTLARLATGPAPTVFLADLSSQSEVRRLVEEVRSRYDHIDVLLNNAGGVFAKRELSVDGIEKTFATNHLAPFLLTNLLLDLLERAPAARIVTVATEIYARKLDFDNLQGERKYQFFKAYQHSKLGNVLFAFELARRLKDTRVTSMVVSPGPSKTNFGGKQPGMAGVFIGAMKHMPMFHSAAEGAKTLLYAATDPALAGVTGRFYYKLRELDTKPVTHDAAIAAKLWSISESLCAGDVRALPSDATKVA